MFNENLLPNNLNKIKIKNTGKRSSPEHVPLLQQFLICETQLDSPDKQLGHWEVEDIPPLQ